MQNVSQAWIDNQNADIRSDALIEIDLEVTDLEAQAEANITSNDQAIYANIIETNESISPLKWATLEKDYWVLDGSFKLLTRNILNEGVGFASASIYNSSGVFISNPVTMTVTFATKHDAPGFSLIFSEELNEYAIAFQIRVFSDGTEIANKLVDDNTNTVVYVPLPVTNYNKIIIFFYQWNKPYRRVRVSSVLWGILKRLSNNDIVSASIESSVDPLMTELPSDTFSMTINNTSREYSMENPEGIWSYFQTRQKLKPKYSYILNNNKERIKGGIYYLTEWPNDQKGYTTSFKAQNGLELLSNTYYKGIYTGVSRSMYDLAVDVLTGSGVNYVLSDTLHDYTSLAPLPIANQSTCLQLIANASCSVIFFDRDGVLHIEPPSTSINDRCISKHNSFNNPTSNLLKTLKQVDVKVYTYGYDATSSDVYKGDLTIAGTQTIMIIYTTPATNVIATLSSGTLISGIYYSNVCFLTITGNGTINITLSGNKINNASSTFSSIVSLDNSETQDIDNPLITSTIVAQSVANYAISVLTKRISYSVDYRGYPELDPLDILSIENQFNTNIFRVTNHKLTFNGGWKGTVEGREY